MNPDDSSLWWLRIDEEVTVGCIEFVLEISRCSLKVMAQLEEFEFTEWC